ncbi:MAG: hypothetical protein MUP30_05585 [Deltaproteobacteria bacterium]|nr:hypothetical protein [Deltaproteobacteria bacterium]
MKIRKSIETHNHWKGDAAVIQREAFKVTPIDIYRFAILGLMGIFYLFLVFLMFL